jgi:hypothetical protein
MKKETKDKLKALGTSALVGVGTFALLRKRKFQEIPEVNSAQKASKGKLTTILSDMPDIQPDYPTDVLLSKNIFQKAKNWWDYSGIKFHSSNELRSKKGPINIRGAVYDDTSVYDKKWRPEKVQADISYNSDKSLLKRDFLDKLHFSKLRSFSGDTPNTVEFSKLFRKGTAITPEKIYKELGTRRSWEQLFIKRRESIGVGEGYQGTGKDILKKRDNENVKDLLKNPDKYIAQVNVPHDREYRAHAVLQGGSADYSDFMLRNINGKLNKKIKSFSPEQMPQLSDELYKVVNDYSFKNPKQNLILGLDVLRSSKYPDELVISEVNDNSSFLWNVPSSARRLYTQVTGRRPVPQSLAASAVIGAGTYPLVKRQLKKESAEKKKKDSFVKSLAVIGGGTVAAKIVENKVIDYRLRDKDFKNWSEIYRHYKDVKPGDLVVTRNTVIPGESHAALITPKGKLMEISTYGPFGSVRGTISQYPFKDFLHSTASRDYDSLTGKEIDPVFDKRRSRALASVYRPRKFDKRKAQKAVDYLQRKSDQGELEYSFTERNFKVKPGCDAKGSCATTTDYVYERAGSKKKTLAYFPEAIHEKGFKEVIKPKTPYTRRMTTLTPLLALSGVYALHKGFKEDDTRKKYIGAGLVAGGGLTLVPKVRKYIDSVAGGPTIATGTLGSQGLTVGTATRLPKVHNKLMNLFDKSSNQRHFGTAMLAIPAIYGIHKLINHNDKTKLTKRT